METTMLNPKLLKPHPKHGHYHSSIAGMRGVYERVRKDIEENGMLTPLLVQSQTYVIVDGHMRQQIAFDLGMESVPVILAEMSDDEAEFALVNENRKRQSKETDPIRVARQMAIIKERFGLKNGQHVKEDEDQTMEELARDYDLSMRQVYKYLRLIRLSTDFQRLVTIKMLGIKSAVRIAGLPMNAQAEFFQVVAATGSAKTALTESLVSEWIEQYWETRKQKRTEPNFSEDQITLDRVDSVTDAIDRQYEVEEVAVMDKLLRQSIVKMAESLPAEAGARFQKAVADRNTQKHLRAIKRLESRLMAVLLPDATPEPEVLDEMSRALVRVTTKLEEVRSALGSR